MKKQRNQNENREMGFSKNPAEEKLVLYALRKFFESRGILHWHTVLGSRAEEQSNFF